VAYSVTLPLATKEGRRSVDKESKRRALVGSLKRLTPEMEETLRKNKAEGSKGMERPDFVWHFLLQSFATMGRSSGWDGLIGDRANYERVTFEALSRLKRLLDEILQEGLRTTSELRE